MRLSVGPIPFSWDKDRIYQFYEEMAKSPATDIYIGETVCYKRSPLSLSDIEAIAHDLTKAGKRVILSSQVLITDSDELNFLSALMDLPYPFEANNAAALTSLTAVRETLPKKEIIAGAYLNVYNSPSIRFLNDLGIRRLVLNPELSKDSILAMLDGTDDMEVEMLVFGKVPLAFSWRCYSARDWGYPRSDCRLVCFKTSQGMSLETLDGFSLFTINGTQILSTKDYCLINELDEIKEMGISISRIIPQEKNTLEVLHIFDDRLKGKIASDMALKELGRLTGGDFCNGWFHSQAGWQYVVSTVST